MKAFVFVVCGLVAWYCMTNIVSGRATWHDKAAVVASWFFIFLAICA